MTDGLNSNTLDNSPESRAGGSDEGGTKTVPFLAPFIGAVLGLAAAILIFSRLKLPYHAYDSIVGPPAFGDFSIRRKFWGYILLTLLPIAGGWFCAWLDRRFGRFLSVVPWTSATWGWKQWIPMGLGLVALNGLESALRWLPEQYRNPLWADRTNLCFWITLVVFFWVMGWLADISLLRESRNEKFENLFWRSSWFVILTLHLWILFQPIMNFTLLAVAAALIYAALFVPLLNCANQLSSCGVQSGFWTIAETAAWWILAVYPLTALAVRLGKTFGQPWANSSAPLISGLIVAVSALICSSMRCHFKQVRKVSPMILIPFSAAMLYSGAGAPFAGYDPYHQGEYQYPYVALTRGLLPFRDVFFVHGFGFNVLPGWITSRWIHDAPNLDVFFLNQLSALGVALAAWLYLRLFGEKWWLLALGLALLTAGAAMTKGSRYVPIYLMAFCVMQYAERKRPAWLIASGLLAWGTFFYVLDVGAVALLAGAAWSLLWEKGEGERRKAKEKEEEVIESFHPKSFVLHPFFLFAIGAGIGALANLIWLIRLGVLRDFLDLHWTYFRMKSHYDNLPFPSPGLIYLLSPLMTVLGAGFLLSREDMKQGALPIADSSHKTQDSSLDVSAAIPFFFLVNALAFLRGLDRSDAGHVVYASAMAWPLLGCLIVWRAGNAAPIQCFLRSLVLVALAALVPLTLPSIRGTNPMTIAPMDLAKGYVANCNRPAVLSAKDLKARDPFFAECEELQKIAKPGEYILDMTDRPAIYGWTDLKCPTRFFAPFYTSNLQWQNEVIRRLEETQTPWVLWPAKNQEGAKIDGIDLQLRDWAIAEYIWSHYQPLLMTHGGSLLLKRGAGANPLQSTFIALLSDSVELGAVPRIWGSYAKGVPPLPSREIVTTEWIEGNEGRVLGPVNFSSLAEATEAQIEFETGWEGEGEFRLYEDRGSDRGGFSARFTLSADHAGPYRIPLASFAGWAWRKAEPSSFSLRFSHGINTQPGGEQAKERPILRFRVKFLK